MEQIPSVKKEVTNNNPKKVLNSELLFFKNEILGDLKQLENKLLKKLELKDDGNQKKIIEINATLDALTKKFFTMSSFFSENITMKDKIDELFQKSSKLQEVIFNHDFKLTTIGKDLVTAINKYDRIIEKSIYYPGVIGASNAKFNTFHNFIDYVMSNISQLNLFKDKTMGMDLKQYKNKLESIIDGFKKQTEEIITNNKAYTSKLIKTLENKFRNDFELYDQRLFNLRIKNTEQVMGIEKLSKSLVNEASKLSDMKNNIEKTYQASIQILRLHYVYTENRINECVKDYDEIRKGLDLIIEALKGLKGGSISNLHEILREFGKLRDYKNDNNKKIKAESLLKKYIVGEMNMEQISQLSKKSTSNIIYNDIKSNVNNIFNDYINSDNNSNNKSRLNRMNTRSVIKYDNNKFSFSKDMRKSDGKTNTINIFSSQRIVFPKRSEIEKKLSSSINIKTLKGNNSDVSINKGFNKLETTFFGENKISKFDLNSNNQFQDLKKNNKNILDEKLSLSNEIPQNSLLWAKGQKNNNFNIKPVSIIKESVSEYKTDNLQHDKDDKEDKENQKEKKSSEENINKQDKAKENKDIINLSEHIKENPEKDKNSTKLKKSPKEGDKAEESQNKKDVISNLDEQTILSTITEHDVITPKGEEEKDTPEKPKKEEKINKQNKINENIEEHFKKNVEKVEEKEQIYEDKDNNTDLQSQIKEFNSRNEEEKIMNNIKNIHLPFDNSFPKPKKDNNFYLEIENKTTNKINRENNKNNIIINKESKIGLQKLFKGERNALNSFKLITKGEDIKIPKIPSQENDRKLTSTKSRTNKDIKSVSSLNFFKSSNNKANNDIKFDLIQNLFENNLDYFVENTDINNFNSLLPMNQQSNVDKNSKLNIIHIPALPQTQRHNIDPQSKDAFFRIEALRKIRNENNRKSNIRKRNYEHNKSDEYIRTLRQFGKLKMNNKLMRTYEGFNM